MFYLSKRLDTIIKRFKVRIGVQTVDPPIIGTQVIAASIPARIRPYVLDNSVASICGSRTIGLARLISEGTTNFETLAYLWLATDSDMNIVITGAQGSGKTTMLKLLLAFIPKFEKTVLIEKEISELGVMAGVFSVTELYGQRYGSVSAREQVINARRINPSRIVTDEVKGIEARELFSSANQGIPFITTIQSNSGGIDLLRKLLVKPTTVESSSLGLLDIAVYMKHSDTSRRLLSEVYEYRWLSRAETDGTGTEMGGDSVDVSCIVANGRLDTAALQSSKVFDAFSKKEGLSKKQVTKEFEKRVKFLKKTCASSKTSDVIVYKVNCYGL